MNKKVVVIGAGNMGGAIVENIIKNGIREARQVTVIDTDRARRSRYAHTLGVHTNSSYAPVSKAQIIILAVKPQQMREAIGRIKRHIHAGTLVISVAAGVKTSWLEKAIGKKIPVIRSMPNLPALIGEGAIAVCRGKYAALRDERQARALLGSVGLVISIPERQMNAVTALSGSGPAYVFYLAEALYRAGRKAGLNGRQSDLLTRQTLLGASRLLCMSKESPEHLRAQVTSPGGTTEAAIRWMEKKNIKGVIAEAVRKARIRAEEISSAFV